MKTDSFKWRASAYLMFALVVTTVAAWPRPAAGDDKDFLTGDVRVYGNRNVRTHIIRREVPFSPGDRFDESLLQEARRRINRLPGVDYSEVGVFVNPQDSSLTLSIVVTEKSAVEGKARFDRGRQNKMGYGLTMTHYNFRGRSERLWTTFLLRGGQSYEVGWENPWVGSPQRIGVGVRGFFEDYDYVYADAGPDFADAGIQRFGGEASVFWTRGGPSRVFVAGGFESVKGDVDGLTFDPDRDNYFSVSAGAILDARDGSRFPWLGAYLETVGKQIAPGDDELSGFEGTVDVRGYVPLLGRAVLAAHSRLIYRDGDVIPLYRREHLGGGRTLRGYDYGSFHGSNALIGGVELRLPGNFSRRDPMEDLLMGVELHFFADTGAAWERGDDVDSDLFFNGYGVGLTLLNRNFAPIRLDWGWREGSKANFEVDVGLKF